jgi:hypothetical protein
VRMIATTIIFARTIRENGCNNTYIRTNQFVTMVVTLLIVTRTIRDNGCNITYSNTNNS